MATAKKTTTSTAKPAEVKEQKYVVVENFYDRNQNGRLYRTGEVYETKGMKADWIEALESGENRAKTKVIKKA